MPKPKGIHVERFWYDDDVINSHFSVLVPHAVRVYKRSWQSAEQLSPPPPFCVGFFFFGWGLCFAASIGSPAESPSLILVTQRRPPPPLPYTAPFFFLLSFTYVDSVGNLRDTNFEFEKETKTKQQMDEISTIV